MATTILDAVTLSLDSIPANFAISAGSNRRAFMAVMYTHSSNAAPPTSATLGGQTMNVLTTIDDDANTFDACMTVFDLTETQIAAMSGSAFTVSGGTYGNRSVLYWSVQGATQGTITPATAATTGTSGSVSLTRVADSYTVGITLHDFTGSAFSGLANPSEAGESQANNTDIAYGHIADSAQTANFTWTHSTSRNNVTFVVNIAPAATDTTAPTLSSATIGTNGTTVTLTFSEAVSIGSGGNGGFAITPSGGAATLSYSSGSGSSSLVYTASRTILQGETATIAYTQPGNGVEDAAGNDLASFSGTSVTNNSTQTAGGPTITSTSDDTPTDGSTLTVNGTGFGTNTGSAGITLGGTSVTPSSWTSTAIQIQIALGSRKYGTNYAIVVTNSTGTASSGYNVQIQPASGVSYVNLSGTLATSGDRITATPDLESGDQVEWSNVAGGSIGDVTVNADGSFTAAVGVTSFDVRVNDGTGWSVVATQYINAATDSSLVRNLARPLARNLARDIAL